MSAEILNQYSNSPEAYNPLANHPDPEQLVLDSLNQGTVLAGREKPFNWELDGITSEGALHRYRAEIEVEALINLAEYGPLEIEISEPEKETLRSLYSPEVFDSDVVIKLDHLGYKGTPPLEHDVKAVEVYLAELLDERDLGHLKEWVHFGMTSEDTNNLAYNLMLRDATNQVIVPSISRVAERLAHLATIYADTPTLGITHAQKASPTTVGKQFGYLLSNITEVAEELDGARLSGKFSGAVGNHNPMTVLFPDFDYDAYSKDFVESMGFTYAPVENQRNDHLAVTDLLTTISRLALVGKDATDNVWLQILGSNLTQKLVAGEKGSSTMSHKINPWRLENAESLFEQAIALVSRAPEGLVASRHERDLSDHGWQRAYGDIIGRVVAGYNYFAVQLDRLAVDEAASIETLNQSAEVLSELVQTAGRVSGDPEAYDKVVSLTQGKKLDLEGIRKVIDEALPDGELKDRVITITPDTYVGVAGKKARESVLGWHAAKLILKRGVLDESTSIDAVLFDLDDTLHFGAKDEVVAKLTAICSELKLGFSEEDIKTYSNVHDFGKMVEAIVTEHNIRNSSNMTVDDFMEANGRVTGKFDNLFYAPPQSKKVIQAMRDSGKATGLVTTRGPISLGRVLDLHGFGDSFDVIVGAGNVKRRKPHPEPLAIALGKLGVNPERSIYVGNDQDADIGAAMALGMKTALVGEDPLDPYGPRPTHHWKDLQQLTRIYAR
ncbi:MAG: lyase family protein [Candidatus Saccharimonadales bacterium]